MDQKAEALNQPFNRVKSPEIKINTKFLASVLVIITNQ